MPGAHWTTPYFPNISGPCIRWTDHLCNSCALSDINQYFIQSLLRMISKCWPIVMSSTHEWATGNCHVTMTYCSRRVSMDAFLSQWHWGQWCKEFVKYTSVPSFSSFIVERIWGSINYLASDVIINWQGATCMTWIKDLIILQWQDSMRTMCGFSTELIRNLSIWSMERQSYVK